MASSSARTNSEHQKILLVDDNINGLTARKCVLEELGYDVTAVSAPTKALEEFNTRHFDLVITDYKMPKLNGLELIQRVRSIRPSIPIILISGFVESLGLNEQNTGADVVLQKSQSEVQLMIRAVSRLLRKQNLRKPPGAARGSGTQSRKRKGAVQG